MNVKIGDYVESIDGHTSIGEGKVIAIGKGAFVVKITRTSAYGDGDAVGSLYVISDEWVTGDYAFYRLKERDSFFKIGESYKRPGSNSTHTIREIFLIQRNGEEVSRAVSVSTNTTGSQQAWILSKADYDCMVKV